ncbi:type 1 glutamine amidotransferase domain-containing protein [Bacillus tianshenii]|nr:type 1 glutamine amidotransferase domain-containing protein [Bacillus tianshenii]
MSKVAKIAVLMTSMFEDVEYTDPVQALKDDGHELKVISDEKGKTIKGKQGEEEVTVDEGIDNISPEVFDALLLPGGFSPDILRGDERFVEFVKHFMYANKPVFAICHGPQLLITAGTLSGRSVTGFKSIHVDLKNAGANVFDEEVVVCGKLVTSREPKDIPAFNKTIGEVLRKEYS